MVKITTTKDKEKVNLIRQQLKENGGYCPCSLLRNEDTRCMCKEFRDSIEAGKSCKCHCGLYELTVSED